LNNPLLTLEELQASANNFTRIAGTAIQGNGKNGSGGGLGSGEMVTWQTACHWVWIGGLIMMLSL